MIGKQIRCQLESILQETGSKLTMDDLVKAGF